MSEVGDSLMTETLNPPTPKRAKRTGRVRLAFHLSMPNVGSWNGKWSGAGRPHVALRSVSGENSERILAKRYFHYSWRDGWGAGVRVERVTDANESRKLQRQSAGFCGYEWMVESIIAYGAIYADHEKPVLNAQPDPNVAGANTNP